METLPGTPSDRRIGFAGTAVTAGAVAGAAHYFFGFDWRVSPLLGAALVTHRPCSRLSSWEAGKSPAAAEQSLKGSRAPTILSVLR